MDNYVVIAVLVAVLGGAAGYVIRAKRKGKKCIGCPYSDKCGGNCGK